MKSGERLAALEGLRGYAALLVFAVHAFGPLTLRLYGVDADRSTIWGDSDPIRVLMILLFRSHYGVDLFFVLSGLLMTDLAVRRWPGTTRFLWRRWLRIYPAFALSTLVFAVIRWWWRDHHYTAAEVWGNVALLQGFFVLDVPAINPVTWSLSYEALFYLAVPFAAVAWTARRPPGVAALAIAYGVIVAAAAAIPVPKAIYFAYFALFIPGIASGLLDDAAREKLASRVPLGAVLLAWVAFTLAVKLEFIFDQGPLYFMCSGLACGLVVLKACDTEGILARALASPIPRWLGRYSYSFFLVHFLVVQASIVWVAERVPTSDRLLFSTLFLVGSLAISIVAARVLYAVTERFYFRRK